VAVKGHGVGEDDDLIPFACWLCRDEPSFERQPVGALELDVLIRQSICLGCGDDGEVVEINVAALCEQSSQDFNSQGCRNTAEARVDDLKDCLAAVQYHHERYDGTGYPTGLKGENIPIDARVIAIADAFDAMTSKRPYRSHRMTAEEGRRELERCAGMQFDPAIVKVFNDINSKHIPKRVNIFAEAGAGPIIGMNMPYGYGFFGSFTNAQYRLTPGGFVGGGVNVKIHNGYYAFADVKYHVMVFNGNLGYTNNYSTPSIFFGISRGFSFRR